MSIVTHTISSEQASAILLKAEGQFSDMKAREISPGKLTRTLSGFANADGGEIYVGAAEQKPSGYIWNGFDREEDANAHLQLIDLHFPINSVTRCAFLSCDTQTGFLLHIEVEKTTEIRNASDGNAYLRRGAQNLPQTSSDQIERLKLNKGLKSYEDATLNTTPDEIIKSNAISQFINDISPTTDPESWLRKQKLLVGTMPTVAGTLLFADEPQIDIPKSAVKIYRYKTSDENGTRSTLAFDPISIDGNAYLQIFASVAKIKEITETIPLLGGDGLEKIEYPSDAIHEIVTNAVIHRDYSLNDDIHVRIFDNIIEVQSPGTLPGHITVKNILDERAARNPKVVRLLNKFKNPPNKDVGEGLNTAFEAMRNLKLRDPIIEKLDIRVLVTLRHEKLGTSEELIVEYLRDHDEITNATARGICFVGSENSMKRTFQKMMKSGLISRIPGRPLIKTGYSKGPNFPK